jgi:hypothetical protein
MCHSDLKFKSKKKNYFIKFQRRKFPKTYVKNESELCELGPSLHYIIYEQLLARQESLVPQIAVRVEVVLFSVSQTF